MILLIDNYDGCVYNLYQLAGSAAPGEEIRIVKNDRITPEEAKALHPGHVILSGGAVSPEHAGNDMALVRELAVQVPILGVCLGMRVICAAYGAQESPLTEPVQGRRSEICVERKSPLFAGMTERFTAARYQSTTVAADQIHAPLCITARAEDDHAVMAVEHETLPVYGVQFHPESFMTEYGEVLMRNFLQIK